MNDDNDDDDDDDDDDDIRTPAVHYMMHFLSSHSILFYLLVGHALSTNMQTM